MTHGTCHTNARLMPSMVFDATVEWNLRTTSAAARVCLTVAIAVPCGGCAGDGEQQEVTRAMQASVRHHNPEGLHRNPGYSQAVAVTGNVTTIYVGGQNAVDASGEIVGRGDIGVQAEQVIRNVETALADAGATIQHVIKWNVYILHGSSPVPGFEAFQRAWGDRPNPPLVTVAFVAGLADPDYLVEIEAVAVVPQE
jgi:enamine deaminase RidA (YjgF/YER057c/UK114 family)